MAGVGAGNLKQLSWRRKIMKITSDSRSSYRRGGRTYLTKKQQQLYNASYTFAFLSYIQTMGPMDYGWH
jgi:hypothetical protein